MGGAVSSGESNDDLIDNLLEADYIKSPMVERVFRAVDRAFYYTEPYKQDAYKDLAWKDGNLHLSAPCIYSEVMENLNLQPGMCFLNVGSGTGYFSTMCGLILGKTGVNHGIELYPDVVNYARIKLYEFERTSSAVDEFEFCPPEFIIGNCLDAITTSKRYDRIYCGAAAPDEYVVSLVDMLKIGGICVVPVGDSLVQITRIEDKKDERKALLPVSFATLITPTDNLPRVAVELPEWGPQKLTELCRSEIRKCMRQTINYPEPKSLTEETRKKKRKRRQQRRRASRLVVVQRRRSGVDMEDDNGFVVAYSVGSNSSDEETNQDQNDTNEQHHDNENGAPSVPTKEGISDDDDKQDGSEDIVMETARESQSSATREPPDTSVSDSSEQQEKITIGENVASSSRNGNAIAAVSGTCSLFSVSEESKTNSGDRRDVNGRRAERRSDSAVVASKDRPIASTSRTTRSARNYRSGAEGFLRGIRELLRARQNDLEPLRRHFQRDSGDTDQVNEGGTLESLDTEMSSSESSPSVTTTNTSSDEEERLNGDIVDKKLLKNEHKPDPLLVNPCSVQMRKKILALPLPPALKVYLNYDRKLYYC